MIKNKILILLGLLLSGWGIANACINDQYTSISEGIFSWQYDIFTLIRIVSIIILILFYHLGLYFVRKKYKDSIVKNDTVIFYLGLVLYIILPVLFVAYLSLFALYYFFRLIRKIVYSFKTGDNNSKFLFKLLVSYISSLVIFILLFFIGINGEILMIYTIFLFLFSIIFYLIPLLFMKDYNSKIMTYNLVFLFLAYFIVISIIDYFIGILLGY